MKRFAVASRTSGQSFSAGWSSGDGPHNVLAIVPARSVENEDDALVLSGTNGFSEARERNVEGHDVHCREQEPLHRTRRRSNEAVEIEPLVSEVQPDERAALSPDASRR